MRRSRKRTFARPAWSSPHPQAPERRAYSSALCLCLQMADAANQIWQLRIHPFWYCSGMTPQVVRPSTAQAQSGLDWEGIVRAIREPESCLYGSYKGLVVSPAVICMLRGVDAKVESTFKARTREQALVQEKLQSWKEKFSSTISLEVRVRSSHLLFLMRLHLGKGKETPQMSFFS